MNEIRIVLFGFVAAPFSFGALYALCRFGLLAGPIVVTENLRLPGAMKQSALRTQGIQGSHILKALLRIVAMLGLAHLVLFYTLAIPVEYALEWEVDPAIPFARGSLTLEVWDTVLWMTLWPLLLAFLGNVPFEIRDYEAFLKSKEQDENKWMNPNRDG